MTNAAPQLAEEGAPPSDAPHGKPIRRHLLWLLVPIVLIGGVLLAILAPRKVAEEAQRPLGPTLRPYPTFTVAPSASPTTQPSLSPSATEVPTTPPTPTPKPQCGGPPQMLILAVGSDEIGLADVIRVVRVDFITPSISVLIIPRDTWVLIPSLGEYGARLEAYFGYPRDPATGEIVDLPGPYGRINTAYFYGNAFNLPGGGPEILAQTLYLNFGLAVDHYVGVDMTVLADVVDAVGGIDINVPAAVDGFSAGPQHMTGEQALAYSRIRYPDTDWHRTERQTLVLLALREKLLQPQTLAAVPSLVDAFIDEVITDLSKAEIAALTCIATKVPRERITSYTITRDMARATRTTRGSYILIPDEEKVQALIAAFLHGQPQP